MLNLHTSSYNVFKVSVCQSLITDTSAYFYLLMKNCPPTQNPRNPKAEYGVDSYLILSDLYVV